MTNHCGSCTACCRIYAIAEMPDKKAGDWCKHCDIGKGCRIYEERPPTCVLFECLWLQSQKREDERERMSPAMRPDKSKVVFAPSTNERIMTATTLPGSPFAWARPDVLGLIERMIKGGLAVVIGAPASTRRKFMSRDGVREVRLTEPDRDGMQWNID
jgi:hypothetical protein